jgi:L-asparaginase
MARPILLIHGGAGSRAVHGERHEVFSKSLIRILEEVYPLLERGENAVKAVTYAVELLENDPLYNAGKGSKIQSDGHIRMSAALMDGEKRRFSGCVNVEGVKNPIRLAEALMKHEDRVLAGPGAKRFARQAGLPMGSPFTRQATLNFEKKKTGKTGTVGAVAIDRKGRLAAATSTGGRGFEHPHRVSDSPTVAGNFANRHCAVSATGVGEQIVEFAVAAHLCSMAEAGVDIGVASSGLYKSAKRKNAHFGWIALNRKGRMIAKTTTETLIWASIDEDGIQIFPER